MLEKFTIGVEVLLLFYMDLFILVCRKYIIQNISVVCLYRVISIHDHRINQLSNMQDNSKNPVDFSNFAWERTIFLKKVK